MKVTTKKKKKITSTYIVYSSNERDPGNLSRYFSYQQVQGSWGKKELMKALLHKKGWFLKAKGTQPKDFQSERNKQGK